MTREDLLHIRQHFHSYFSSFDYRDKKIEENARIKKQHSCRVSAYAKDIAQHSGQSENDILLSETAGLLHDIGRFEQYSRYRTFSDSKSVDHATLGCQIIKKKKILDNLPETEQHVLLYAIEQHNKKAIDTNCHPSLLPLAKLLRDADKVDIYYLISTYYLGKDDNSSLVLDLPSVPDYNPTMLTDMYEKKIADKKHLTTVNDFKLMQISWIFDINYPYSLGIILKKQYLQTIFSTLPNTEEIRKMKQFILQQVQEKAMQANISQQ